MLLAQKENILVLDDQMALFSSPANSPSKDARKQQQQQQLLGWASFNGHVLHSYFDLLS